MAIIQNYFLVLLYKLFNIQCTIGNNIFEINICFLVLCTLYCHTVELTAIMLPQSTNTLVYKFNNHNFSLLREKKSQFQHFARNCGKWFVLPIFFPIVMHGVLLFDVEKVLLCEMQISDIGVSHRICVFTCTIMRERCLYQ